MPKKQFSQVEQLTAASQSQPLPQSAPSQTRAAKAKPTELASASSRPAKPRGKAGAPRGNRNAAKVGDDLRLEMYLSKYKRSFFEQYFEFKLGRPARSDDELRETFRQIAYAALDHAIAEELERHNPGSIKGSSGETF